MGAGCRVQGARVITSDNGITVVAGGRGSGV